MVGGNVEQVAYAPATVVGDVVLTTGGLSTTDDRGIPRLDGVGVHVRSGEIVGVAGVAGNGQDELVECLVGLRRPTSGRVELNRHQITDAPVGVRRERGLSYISADRAHEGLAVDSSLLDNTLAGHQRDQRLERRGWISRSRAAAFVGRVLQRYGVRFGALSAPARHLSGGNQQRLVVGRELEHDPIALVAAHPTRGVDIKGIAFVHRQLLERRDRGAAILIVSEELDELLALADRIVVLYRGQVIGEVPGQPDQRQQLGRLMTGEVAVA
jgi:simple sugar transport system ATP-binding protein